MKTILSAFIMLVVSTICSFAQPAFPTNIVVTPQTNGTVGLTWTPSSSTNANSVLYVGIAPGVYNVSFVVTNGGNYTLTNVTPGFTYYFRVRAKDRTTGIESDPSSEVSSEVKKPLPTGNDLRTTQITPVLEYGPTPSGPWTRGVVWQTKTFVTDEDKKFFRVVVESNHGSLITKL